MPQSFHVWVKAMQEMALPVQGHGNSRLLDVVISRLVDVFQIESEGGVSSAVVFA